jgi:hypothetical protein
VVETELRLRETKTPDSRAEMMMTRRLAMTIQTTTTKMIYHFQTMMKQKFQLLRTR